MDKILSNSAIHRKGDLFFWQGNLGSADASTLDIPVGSILPDVIAVTSHRTGCTVPFSFHRVERLGTPGDAIAIYGSNNGFTLHIYND